MNLKDYIRIVEDFPKAGISFKDVSPILGNGKALQYTIDELAKHCTEADVLIGPDARGFLFATPVAYKLGKPMAMVRKPGKLPGKLLTKAYDLEYGQNILTMQDGIVKPGQKVIIVDDLMATGGTTKAAVDLITELGAEVIKIVTVIELTGLKGRQKFPNIEVVSLLEYEF